MKWSKTMKDIESIYHPILEFRRGKNCALLRPGILRTREIVADSFQFLLCQGRLPALETGHGTFRLLPETVLPLPTGLEHRWTEEAETDRLLIVLFDPDFVTQLLRILHKEDFMFSVKPLICDYEVKQLLAYETREALLGGQGKDVVFEALEQLLLIHFVRQYENRGRKIDLDRKEIKRDNILKAIELMRTSINRELTLKELAEAANVSPYHFIRIFKLETGMTPFDYLMNIKLNLSLEMVEHTDLPVAEVCYACGFVNISHFSKVFKSKFGFSPKDLRHRFKKERFVSIGMSN